MTIQQLQKEKILSRKTNKIRSATLGIILDSAKKIAKEDNRDATEADIMTAAKRNIKALSKTINELGSGDLVDRYKAEIAVCEEFLPVMVDEATLSYKIKNIVMEMSEDQRNIKAMGRVMGAIKKEYGDAVDMAVVSRIVKKVLS